MAPPPAGVAAEVAAGEVGDAVGMRYEGHGVVGIPVQRHHLHPDTVVGDKGQVVLDLRVKLRNGTE